MNKNDFSQNPALDPTLQMAAFSALESAINAALSLDPGTAKRLQSLDKQAFHLRCTVPAHEVYLVIRNQKIELHAIWEQEITSSLSGPATEFARLLSSKDKGAALINSALSLRGDSAALIKLQEILADIDLDWEGELARVLGDVPAHLLGQTARHLSAWSKQTSALFMRHLEEFLHEEARLSPSRLEIECFIKDIQQLTMDTERLEARINRLEQSLKNRK
jgi:ubiquinone biosynthesis protein UbiJ